MEMNGNGKKKEREEHRGITLKKALQLIDSGYDIFSMYKESENRILDAKIYTRKDIVNKFDLKNTYVVKIDPYFICEDFEGFAFILAD